MKTNVYTFFSFTQFDSMKPIQLIKNYEKTCISLSDFYRKIINNKHTLLYNLPIIQSIQRYNGLCELTNPLFENIKSHFKLCICFAIVTIVNLA